MLFIFFLTLDRFLAVCSPSIFSKLNINKFLILSLSISFLITCLELEDLTERNIIGYNELNVTGLMLTVNWWGKIGVNDFYMVKIIILVKFCILISMISCGSAIVYKLRQRGRRVIDMVSADQAKKELREMIDLCRFQMLDTVIMALDVCLSLSTSLYTIVTNNITDHCSYEEATYDYYLKATRTGLDYVSGIFQSFAHGELFIFYLIFFGKFRRAMADLSKSAFTKSVIAFRKTKSNIGSLMYG